MKIPKDRIRRATYTKGGGNGSWLAQGLSGWFGLNVTITNNYNKRHRMKLRMYEQDYIIYRAVGIAPLAGTEMPKAATPTGVQRLIRK